MPHPLRCRPDRRSPSGRSRSPATPTACATGSASTSDYVPEGIDFNFVAPRGNPGILSVTFETPHGPVTV